MCVCVRARACVCVCVCLVFCIILYVNCFGRSVLYMYIEYHIWVNMYRVSAQGVDERMVNVHYFYISFIKLLDSFNQLFKQFIINVMIGSGNL